MREPKWWPGAPKEPPANGHEAAVKLRRAAVAFAIQPPSADLHDREGMKRNRALLLAAVEYARAAEKAVR